MRSLSKSGSYGLKFITNSFAKASDSTEISGA